MKPNQDEKVKCINITVIHEGHQLVEIHRTWVQHIVVSFFPDKKNNVKLFLNNIPSAVSGFNFGSALRNKVA